MNYVPHNNQPSMLTQDNTKIKNEVYNYFSRGDMRYNKGATVAEKEEGLSLILQGLKTMKLWIAREHDPSIVQSLNSQYQGRYEDVKKKMDYLEQYKNQSTIMTDQGGQQMAKKPNQGGNGQNGGGNNEENDKFKNALSDAIVTTKPNVKWTDIAGLKQAKNSLQEAVLLPIKFPQIFEGARKPWKGILLYGPPGTGKTYLAQACATEAEGTFFSVSSSDLISKYVGESEKLIKTLFNMARDQKPAIIFIDEVDSMCGARGEGQNEASRRVITEFLVQMQGVGHDDKGILVLGATNLPWALDSAIRRRFEKRIYIPLPDEAARDYMIRNSLKGNKHSLTDNEIQILAQKTEGYSGSDISIFVRDAVYEPIRKLQSSNKFKEIMMDGQKKYVPAEPNDPNAKEINFMQIDQKELHIPDVSMVFDQLFIKIDQEDFIIALGKAKKSVSQDQLKEYVNWTTEFGQDG